MMTTANAATDPMTRMERLTVFIAVAIYWALLAYLW